MISINAYDIDVVLCVRNSAELLRRSILGLTGQGLPSNQIIVIDGQSSDSSYEVAAKLGCSVFSDEGKGFVYARNLGINKTDKSMILILGPDDELKPGSLRILSETLLSDWKIAAVQAKKRVDPKFTSFLDRGMDYYYKTRPVGIVKTVGNPTLYRADLLRSERYDPEFSANEDTDWCQRVGAQGYKIVRSKQAESIEIESLSFDSFLKRWLWYGEGDFNFVRKYLKIQPLIAFRHLLHPANEYMIWLPGRAILKLKFSSAIFLFLCGVLRYFGFINAFLKNTVRQKMRKSGR